MGLIKRIREEWREVPKENRKYLWYPVIALLGAIWSLYCAIVGWE